MEVSIPVEKFDLINDIVYNIVYNVANDIAHHIVKISYLGIVQNIIYNMVYDILSNTYMYIQGFPIRGSILNSSLFWQLSYTRGVS